MGDELRISETRLAKKSVQSKNGKKKEGRRIQDPLRIERSQKLLTNRSPKLLHSLHFIILAI